MADRRLQVFHAVAKHLSFTKAADALFMTQPAVTFQIRQLEQHFNTRLFDRTQGRIALTPAGATALEYAERILALSAELDSRLKDMSGQLVGPLLIGASTTIADYLLPQILGQFRAVCPGVAPRLFVGNSESVQDRVGERALDIGFIEGDSHLPTLVSECLCEDELQLVCAPGHPLARQKSVSASALVKHAYLSREQGSGTREVTDHYLEKAGFAPNALGYHDMGGNVAEWTSDLYTVQPSASAAAVDPLAVGGGKLYVIRGSSWRHATVTELRAAFRDFGEGGRDDVGLRIARYAE